MAWAEQGPSGVACHFTRLAFPEEATARARVHEIKAHNHRMVGGGSGGVWTKTNKDTSQRYRTPWRHRSVK